MKYLFLIFIALMLPSSASAVWFDSNWDYRVKVEVAPTMVGSSTALTNFPVYVDLGQMPLSFFSNASSSGADIRVTESDGSTETPFEVVSFGTREVTSVTETITTSTTTWQLPSNVSSNQVTVEAWGGGGGGGDGLNTGGGGGGGGAYASSSLILATSTDYAVTVGAGGAKGAATSAGSAGTDTSFNGGQVYADGGTGGNGCNAVNCAGGAGGLTANSVGSSTYAGGTGGTGANAGDIGGGGGEAAGSLGTGANASGQAAGSSVGTGGDGGTGGANAGSGSDGTSPGGGGGGGENNSTGATGKGARGQVNITYSIATTTVYYGELHFLADGLATTSTSTYYIYYGNPSATSYATGDTYGRNNVWTGYVAVYHMQETSGDNLSATGNNTGTDTNTVGTGEGKLTNGRDFNRSVAEHFELLNANQTNLGIINAITISTWVKGSSVMTNNIGRIVWRLGGTGSYGYQLSTAGLAYTPNNSYAFSIVGTGGGTDFGFGTAGDAVSETLKHVVATYDGTNIKGYVNNSKTTSGTFTNYLTNANAETFYVGRSTGGDYFGGILDEIRVASDAKSESWIVTEYNNQSSPSTFFYIGPEETEGAPPATSSTDTDILWFD